MAFSFCVSFSIQVCRKETYLDRLLKVVKMLPQMKEKRLPPPRVNQSQVSLFSFL
jgi:hypothetical protein